MNMKKIITLFTIIFLFINGISAQFFQGSFQRDVTDNVNLKISFKMKPTNGITTQISYMEAAFRFPTNTTPAFVITNINSNTDLFPGLSFQRFTPDYAADGYTYYKFVFNTAILSSVAYTGTDYRLFDITTSLPATSKPAFEMISNFTTNEYNFGTVDGAGNLINPNEAEQLYGPGFYRIGADHILPLFAGPLPVTFRSFTVVKKDKDAQLDWIVENQEAGTSHYIIERSVDGNKFTGIETIAAKFSSGAKAYYQFRDLNIADLLQEVIYYRIKQVDKDGRYVYTNILKIRLESQKLVQLYPNPVRDEAILSFSLKTPQKVIIVLMNINGKVIQQITLKGMPGINHQNLEVSKLPAGTYNVSIHSAEFVETLQLIKVR